MTMVRGIAFETYSFETVKIAGETVRNAIVTEYLVPDTDYNYETIQQMRFVRDIQLVRMFDFQFEREFFAPIELYSEVIWTRLYNEQRDLFLAAVAEELVS